MNMDPTYEFNAPKFFDFTAPVSYEDHADDVFDVLTVGDLTASSFPPALFCRPDTMRKTQAKSSGKGAWKALPAENTGCVQKPSARPDALFASRRGGKRFFWHGHGEHLVANVGAAALEEHAHPRILPRGTASCSVRKTWSVSSHSVVSPKVAGDSQMTRKALQSHQLLPARSIASVASIHSTALHGTTAGASTAERALRSASRNICEDRCPVTIRAAGTHREAAVTGKQRVEPRVQRLKTEATPSISASALPRLDLCVAKSKASETSSAYPSKNRYTSDVSSIQPKNGTMRYLHSLGLTTTDRHAMKSSSETSSRRLRGQCESTAHRKRKPSSDGKSLEARKRAKLQEPFDATGADEDVRCSCTALEDRRAKSSAGNRLARAGTRPTQALTVPKKVIKPPVDAKFDQLSGAISPTLEMSQLPASISKRFPLHSAASRLNAGQTACAAKLPRIAEDLPACTAAVGLWQRPWPRSRLQSQTKVVSAKQDKSYRNTAMPGCRSTADTHAKQCVDSNSGCGRIRRYKPLEIKRSDKPLTKPHSPHFSARLSKRKEVPHAHT